MTVLRGRFSKKKSIGSKKNGKKFFRYFNYLYLCPPNQKYKLI